MAGGVVLAFLYNELGLLQFLQCLFYFRPVGMCFLLYIVTNGAVAAACAHEV